MRYGLRTLLIAAALGPPALAGMWFLGLWLADDENQRTALTAFLLAMLYLAAVAVAVYAKRIVRAAAAFAGRWIKD